jgi:predicted NUDIX family NTP pyrophosphohydrolase
VKGATSGKMSAGLLLYRHSDEGIEVLLGHPGGPFWRNKDLASWSIPKGLITEGEAPLDAAKREFTEETGHKPTRKARPLGEAKQPGGKIVHVWATEGDLVSKAICSRWSGRQDRGGGRAFLNWTVRVGLESTKRVPRF